MKKTLGEYTPLEQKLLADIKELIGQNNFPITMTVANGQLVQFEYETEWKQGATHPEEKQRETFAKYADGSFKLDDGGNKIPTTETYIEYREDYTDHHLTDEQVEKLDKHIKNLLPNQDTNGA